MQWRPIEFLPEEPLSERGEALRRLANERVDALRQARAAFDAQLAAVQAAGAEQLGPEQVQWAQAAPLRIVELLKLEVEARQLVADFAGIRPSERRKYADELSADCERAKARVKAKLVEIGYVDGPLPGANSEHVRSITEEMLGRHPEVLRLRVERDAAGNKVHEDDDMRRNAVELKAAKDELAARTKRLLAVA